VHRLRYLWFVLPALGLLELALHLWFSTRAATLADWRNLTAVVAARKRAGEPVVVAPEWAEPLARLALGDRAFPVAELARDDDASVQRVLEVAELGARASAFVDWRVASESRSGPFTLRVLENPKPLHAKYRFVEHVAPGELEVAVVANGSERPCVFRDHARVTAGGLHGQVAFPSVRFACPGGDEMFVGVTIIDDQAYRPRRCLWAHPPAKGFLRLRFRDVPLGTRLHGGAGLSYFLFRDGVGAPITLTATSGGVQLGAATHRDEDGWTSFDFSTPALAGQSATVDFEVRSAGDFRRDYCFSAEVVE